MGVWRKALDTSKNRTSKFLSEAMMKSTLIVVGNGVGV